MSTPTLTTAPRRPVCRYRPAPPSSRARLRPTATGTFVRTTRAGRVGRTLGLLAAAVVSFAVVCGLWLLGALAGNQAQQPTSGQPGVARTVQGQPWKQQPGAFG